MVHKVGMFDHLAFIKTGSILAQEHIAFTNGPDISIAVERDVQPQL